MRRINRLIAAAPLLIALVYSQIAFDISLEFCRCTQSVSGSAKTVGAPHDLNQQKDALQRLADVIVPVAAFYPFLIDGAIEVHAVECHQAIFIALHRANPGRAPPTV